MDELAVVAPAFVEMAHRIVWCSAATIDKSGRPRSRILHPVWDWDGEVLKGIIATGPNSPKRGDLDAHPLVSLSYWQPNHDTCSAECTTEWKLDDASRAAGWDRIKNAPAPVGYDPAIIPGWDSPASPNFGILEVTAWRLRVMPGTVMMGGGGSVLSWVSPQAPKTDR